MDQLFQLKQKFDQRGILLSFSGPISQNFVVEIGETLRDRMTLEDIGKSTTLKVFAMLIEQAQNILHYSAETLVEKKEPDSGDCRYGIITVGREGDHFYVSSGNTIKNEQVEKLRMRLSKLQKMTRKELKEHFKKKRKKPVESGSKGGGLGFIELARKSCRPMEFDFMEINDDYTFFSIKTVI